MAPQRLDARQQQPRPAHGRCTCIHRALAGLHATATCPTAKSRASPSQNTFTRAAFRAGTRKTMIDHRDGLLILGQADLSPSPSAA